MRRKFVADVSLYPRQTLLFIDETGSDSQDVLRKQGYSIRGQPAMKQSLVVCGEHVTAIAAMSMDGCDRARPQRRGAAQLISREGIFLKLSDNS